MKIVVVTKNYSDADERHPMWEHLRTLGHEVVIGNPTEIPYGRIVPDAIVCWSITLMDQAFQAMDRWPAARLYCYNWDVYERVWTSPRREETPGTPAFLDYRRYGDLLRLAREVWVPSDCTGRRTTQWYGITSWTRILSSCPWWEHPNVRDDGYALMCLREQPDPWWGVFERCCEELRIPYKAPRHELSLDEYKDVVAGCRFICAPLYELSTGGLSLMEAYYHGKPVLLSDSEWNGGRDYFGGRAHWFDHRSEDDLKRALSFMFYKGAAVAPDHKEYITTNFSDRRMAEDVHRRLIA